MVKDPKIIEKKLKWWEIVLLIIIIIAIINYYDNKKEENCDLTFSKYTYSEGCAGTCSVKCSDEGFSYLSSSYFEPYLSYEEMMDTNLYKRCECNCGGCKD